MVSPSSGLQLLSASARFPNNPLLVRDTVGKKRPTVYELPAEDHVYGKTVVRDPEECAATGKSDQVRYLPKAYLVR